MPGTWTKVADNCTSYASMYVTRCQEWSNYIIAACIEWATSETKVCDQEEDQGHQECTNLVDEGHNECDSWGWFSWVCEGWHWVERLVCHAWTWVSHIVCVAWHWVAAAVCVASIWLVQWICIAWEFVTSFICNNKPNGGTVFLLTDGTVMINEMNVEYGTRRWWKLTPDLDGSYVNGTWSRLADSNVARKYWASAVLNDGRVIICGGEYSDASGSMSQDETNRCEIYDPVADTWTALAPPTGWNNIGDGACALLADGRFLIGNAFDRRTAVLDSAAGAWGPDVRKNNKSSEESWLLLGDGTVVSANCNGHPAAEKFVPVDPAVPGTADVWIIDTPVPGDSDLVEDASSEIGCSILMPDTTGFFAGATSNTAFYVVPSGPSTQGSWTPGPKFPPGDPPLFGDPPPLGIKDGPGCLLPNGNVLLGAAPVNGKRDDYLSPTYFFELDGTSFNRTADPPTHGVPVYKGRMLLIPTGELLYAVENSPDIYAYRSTTKKEIDPALKPVITDCPPEIGAGTTVQISGRGFHGVSGAVGYGDDSSAWTNYPIVRVTNFRTSHVQYCRTSNHTRLDASGAQVVSMGVATGAAVITTTVAVPSSVEKGLADLEVVANGIASDRFRVRIT
jgi:hypothetical protein